MKTIKIAFYKNSKSFFWALIRFKQRYFMDLPQRYARYSHTEIVFEDWIFFSSSEEDWWVRFKKINPKPNHWDFLELEVSNKDYRKILNFCKRNNWNAYNWFGIVFAQTLWLNWFRKPWDYFCSEIVTRAIQEAKYMCYYDSLFISPWQLAYIMEDWKNIIN